MKNLFYLFSFILSASCSSQDLKALKLENDDLKYFITYVDNTSYEKRVFDNYFVKTYKVLGKNYALEISSEYEDKSYSFQYYFLVSSFDERSDVEAKLFKISGLYEPLLVSIKLSEDKKSILITISTKTIKDDSKILNDTREEKKIKIKIA